MTDATLEHEGRAGDDAHAAARPRSWLVEGVGVLVGTLLVGYVASTVLVLALAPTSASSLLVQPLSYLGSLATGGLLLSLLLLVPTAWWVREAPARRRVGWYVLASLVPHAVVLLVQSGTRALAGDVQAAGWLAGASLVGLVAPVVEVALAAAVVVSCAERWRAGVPWRGTAVVRGVEVAGLGLGVLLVVALFFQFLDVNLSLYGDQPPPTAADGSRYVVTAVACLSLVLAGTVAAGVGRHIGVLGLGIVLLLVAAVAAVVLAVPGDRFEYEPPRQERPAYEPCYSGSGDCVGG
ncbi:DUF6234 family protein [Cellulomonas fimi]|uniref:Uncharacterized protein n=1 Tax=Cellulomonas fimi (strain ATCC 484 / DSM 20113 / JCM 1341 / CCUG 24087 / LMG 16345 / NBRC 15513 / NCIMB 8980 / NCTC 7547 / NRS-133) TaxID=590998 RepID=F4H5W1_CELFA|nr:DUF6234 family protein [Cellulomonas fimi]AEE45561.1 hypothetical protein Celf_1426 [Cellulomonas fimi ATCC 484]NNH05928.1 hypothetical protein [Cellulomonas fimi]VEH29865.1 Uncharacterised protein [Cellulomonas fimi]